MAWLIKDKLKLAYVHCVGSEYDWDKQDSRGINFLNI